MHVRRLAPPDAAAFQSLRLQGLREDLRRLATLDQVAAIDHHRRHAVDAGLLPEALGFAHLVAELAAGEHRARAFDIEPDGAGQFEQHLVRARVAALAVVGLQQRLLQCMLRASGAFDAGPVQQAVGIEGVPDLLALAEGEAHRGAALGDALARAQGVVGRVRKTRLLLLAGQTRIHLDRVEGLGDFLELEVVLREGQSEAEGEAIAEQLMAQLGVSASQRLAGAYLDLLGAAA